MSDETILLYTCTRIYNSFTTYLEISWERWWVLLTTVKAHQRSINTGLRWGLLVVHAVCTLTAVAGLYKCLHCHEWTTLYTQTPVRL